MTPQEFIHKWKTHALTERAAAQEHFIDLCRMFDHPTPAEDDPRGDHFAFEKGAPKTGGGEGWADVWKKGFFAWEYKKRKRNLDDALVQLTRYAAALEHPPLLVVCDTIRFQIVTTWTNLETKTYAFELEDLADPATLAILRAVFHDPDALRPVRTRAKITAEAADKFQTISDRLQHRNPDREAVAHFVNQLVFCFFADSVKLLPEGLLKKLLQTAERRPHKAKDYFDKLFSQMESGGEFDLTEIAHFNGGLFDGRRALELEHGEIGLLFAAASLDWSLIDPTVFGTLFERFLDPDKRAQIGAHYTDPDKIMMIVEPVVLRPLRREWEAVKAEIDEIMRPATTAAPAGRDGRREHDKKLAAARAKAEARRDAFIDRLTQLRILDPACGSGNFLYLALQGVKDVEYLAIAHCELYELGRPPLRVGPEILRGVEINPFAAELARMTIWIGDIQWSIRNGIYSHPEPILRKLDAIECRDAVLTREKSDAPIAGVPSPLVGEGQGGGSGAIDKDRATPSPYPSPQGGGERSPYAEASWPDADFIVGNPPFLGGKLMRKGLGDDYVDALFSVYAGRVPAEADLVCYWFAKAWDAVRSGRAERVGLVSTNSIRGGGNRRVLEPVAREGAIFEAWSDEPWIVEGAAVRVSLVCFGNSPLPLAGEGGERSEPSEGADAKPSSVTLRVTPSPASREKEAARLNGATVETINADLTGHGFDITQAKRLAENAGRCFQGPVKVGRFDVEGALGRSWLLEPTNANGKSNSVVLRPWVNGSDLVRRPSGKWIIDFADMSEREAALFEAPFEFVKREIKPLRLANRDDQRRRNWWRLGRSAGDLRAAVDPLNRCILTPRVSKHRIFVWETQKVLPDSAVVAIARDDDATFGVLHSRFHEAWALRLCTWLGVGNDPRYTPTTTFETFPFPEGLTPNIPAKDYESDPRAQRIAEAAKRLDELRRNWLNPPDLVDILPEVVPFYPDRVLPKDTRAAAILKERTLTNLYNQRPQWLVDAHAELDRAVAAAYGWPEDISTEDALAKLLELNLARSSAKEEADA